MTLLDARVEQRSVPDLRAPALGVVAWVAALGALQLPAWWSVVALAAPALVVLARWRRGRPVRTHVTWWVIGAGVVTLTLLRVAGNDTSPVAALARQRAVVEVRMVTTSDPVVRTGRFSRFVVLRARVVEVVGRAARHRVRDPVLVLADTRWRSVALGSTVRVGGRLQPASTNDLTAVISPRGPPRVLSGPGSAMRSADDLRASIRAAAAGRGAAGSALVPALVDGDDAGMPAKVVADFRTAGLTHLLAVSGTNLTLVVGSLLLLARWARVRGRWLAVVGIVGVAGFVLLARTEPSVVRAAVMGSVALIGMGSNGRERGSRALGIAVLLLLLVDPWLARSPGFALSVLATAGILWLAPSWRDRLTTWLPRWVAEAVSVPLAAQLACTPLVAGLSGQVSLVAVAANLAAAPLVGPATVLGLLGGVLGLVSTGLGRVVATPAVWCAEAIVAIATRSAGLPVAAFGWPTGPVALAVLTLLCLLIAAVTGPLLSRPSTGVTLALLMTLAVLVPLPTPGWPPNGWVMVACDVGQGDGIVLRAGPGQAVVVDVGPDPAPMDDCLERLGVKEIPLLVVTHFDADHSGGLAGAIAGRRVGSIAVSGVAEPVSGVRRVEAIAARAGVEVRRAAYGETGALGPLRWQVVAPSRPPSSAADSASNDGSVVLLVEVRGRRILLAGDQGPLAQQQLGRDVAGLSVDVLKVAHHGSSYQDPDLVRSLGARLAVISVGKDNGYGHPTPSLLALLRDTRARIARTDQDGDVAVVVNGAAIRVVTRR